MEISDDVYQWLKTAEIVGEIKETDEGKYYFDKEAVKNLEYGCSFREILSRTFELYKNVDKKFYTKNNISVIKQQRDNACKNFN